LRVRLDFPADEPILGDNGMNLDWPGGHGNENTAIQEEMAYWIADQMNIAFSHRYFIRLTVNGVTDMQRATVFRSGASTRHGVSAGNGRRQQRRRFLPHRPRVRVQTMRRDWSPTLNRNFAFTARPT
jgi:hypothetical protein